MLEIGEEAQGGTDLPSSSLEALTKAEIVIPVITPAFLKSRWFTNKAKPVIRYCVEASLSREGKKLVIPVWAMHPGAVLSAEKEVRGESPLLQLQGEPFTLWNGESWVILSDPQTTHEAKDGYSDRLEHLAWEIQQALSERPKEIQHAVYIALTGGARQDQREKLRRTLRRRGFRVEPSAFSRWDRPDDFKIEVKKRLKDCSLFLQVATPKGTVEAGFPEDAFDLEHQIAKDERGENKVLRWIDDKMEDGNDLGAIIETLSCFTDRVTRLLRAPQDAAISTPVSPSSRVMLYIDFHPDDTALAEQLFRELDDHDVSYTDALQSANVSEHMRFMKDLFTEESLRGSVYLYGSGNSHEHVKKRLLRERSVRRRLAVDRRLGFALVDGPPPDKEVARFSFPDVVSINCREGVTFDKLKEFIAGLG